MTLIESIYTCGHRTIITETQRGLFTIEERIQGGSCYDCQYPRAVYSEDTTMLDVGATGAKAIRDSNPAAYYGKGPGADNTGGCSCSPSNGPNCVNCR